MNKKTTIALFAALPLLWGCTQENDFGIPKSEGDEAVFVISPKKTRTMYANGQWDATENQELYWGNYIKSETDRIRVYCGQAAHPYGTYEIQLKNVATGEQGSNAAGGVRRVGEAGVQWGPEGTAHTFYAFYPADNASLSLSDNDHSMIAIISNGQSAKSFRAVVANGTTYEDDNQDVLAKVYANSAQNKDNQTNIFCQPDMDNAAMVACTDMSGKYGQDVPLDFNVIADVLDITVNGPIVPNQLAGNAEGESRKFINIRSVRVESIKGEPIVGTFHLDMKANKVTKWVNGMSSLQIQLNQTSGGKTYNPTLYARVEKNESDKVDNKYQVDPKTEVDHLRVRAFLAPGAVTNLSQLKVIVQTDCGDYTQELKDFQIDQSTKPNPNGPEMIAGKITRLKLGYFQERGMPFDYTKWMSQLDHSIYINELSIPGSWHSTDSRYQGQMTAIADQYKKGIRAFETHATCVPDPVLSGENKQVTTDNDGKTPTYGSLVKASDSEPDNASASNRSRKVKRTVTYTLKTTETRTGTVTKWAYSVTNSAGKSMLQGITNLGNVINDTEFAIIEIGSPGSQTIDVPVVGALANGTVTTTKTIVKEQTATQTAYNFWGWHWSTVSDSDWSSVTAPTAADWASAKTEIEYKWTYDKVSSSINSFIGGVSWLINELKNEANSKLYTGGITPSTTLGQVQGHYIIKVNTNKGGQNTEDGWGTNVPALFSRWMDNSEDNINTAALKWGGPIDPASTSDMVWVFSEKDNIGSITNRHTAWEAFVKSSLDAYKSTAHNAWFEFSGGGYLHGDATVANCQEVATDMNPWLLGQISDAARQACPLGLVFFNYAADGDDTADQYSSNALVRAIINNNASFELRRDQPQPVTERTNAFFNLKEDNPFK